MKNSISDDGFREELIFYIAIRDMTQQGIVTVIDVLIGIFIACLQLLHDYSFSMLHECISQVNGTNLEKLQQTT